MSENLIPVADVTEEEKNKALWASEHARACKAINEELAAGRPFVFVSLGEEGTRVTSLADLQGMEFGIFSLLTTLGDELSAGKLNQLPVELANNIKMVTAMTHMQRRLQAMTSPHTPATDAGVDSKH